MNEMSAGGVVYDVCVCVCVEYTHTQTHTYSLRWTSLIDHRDADLAVFKTLSPHPYFLGSFGVRARVRYHMCACV